MESGRVGEVERLLQVVTVVRVGDGLPVSRASLVAQVEEYRTSTADADSVNKAIDRDLAKLAELSILVENVAPPGAESAYVLRDGAWRLPIDLSDQERGLLAWAMAAAGAAGAEAQPLSTAPDDLSSLLGAMPRSLDLAQAAIAGRRRLRITRDGEGRTFTPAMLASRAGRWFLLGCFDEQTDVKAPRLDRLEIIGLGEPADLPRIEHPDDYLDATAWGTGEKKDAELRCRTEDLDSVLSWFPRAEVCEVGDGQSALRFWVRDEANLVDRVIGLAAATWIVAPETALRALRDRVEHVMAEVAP